MAWGKASDDGLEGAPFPLHCVGLITEG